jgi:hypothetical protein
VLSRRWEMERDPPAKRRVAGLQGHRCTTFETLLVAGGRAW